MTAYSRGVYREKKTADHLRSEGYFCVESRGSHGPADVVAMKPGQVLLVQVKSGNTDVNGALRDIWWNELYQLARQLGAVPVLADTPSFGKLRLRRLAREHEPMSKRWWFAPFHTDEVMNGEFAVHPQGRPLIDVLRDENGGP
jgi:Holliday junction resolvase